jgi:GNAT superfamily N-acetyltransferase
MIDLERTVLPKGLSFLHGSKATEGQVRGAAEFYSSALSDPSHPFNEYMAVHSRSEMRKGVDAAQRRFDEIRMNPALFFLVRDGEIVGHFAWKDYLVNDAELSLLIAEVSLHRLGIGSEALAILEEDAKVHGKECLYGMINEKNSPSRNFFLKNGYHDKYYACSYPTRLDHDGPWTRGKYDPRNIWGAVYKNIRTGFVEKTQNDFTPGYEFLRFT